MARASGSIYTTQKRSSDGCKVVNKNKREGPCLAHGPESSHCHPFKQVKTGRWKIRNAPVKIRVTGPILADLFISCFCYSDSLGLGFFSEIGSIGMDGCSEGFFFQFRLLFMNVKKEIIFLLKNLWRFLPLTST